MAEIVAGGGKPIFSNTAQYLYLAMDDTKKDAMAMAFSGLQDLNLTAILLSPSNNPYHNPSQQGVSVDSEAISSGVWQ